MTSYHQLVGELPVVAGAYPKPPVLIQQFRDVFDSPGSRALLSSLSLDKALIKRVSENGVLEVRRLGPVNPPAWRLRCPAWRLRCPAWRLRCPGAASARRHARIEAVGRCGGTRVHPSIGVSRRVSSTRTRPWFFSILPSITKVLVHHLRGHVQ